MIDGAPVQVEVAGTLDEARAEGWRHPNCRCTTVAYLPGAQLLKGTTYDPEAEAARDKLRALERAKRDAKRQEAGALDDVERQRAKARIRGLDARIRAHVDETGLNRRRYREQLGFSDGPKPPKGPTPGPATPPTKPPAPVRQLPPKPEPKPIAQETPDARDFRLMRERAASAQQQARANLSEQIARAKNVPQIAEAMKAAYPQIEFGNWSSGTHIETAREFATTLHDLMSRYPIDLIRNVNFKSMSSKGTIAHAQAFFEKYDFQMKNGATRINIEMNTRFSASRNRQTMLDSAHRAVESGHFHNIPAGQELRYIVSHEYGHAIDFSIKGQRARAEYLKIVQEHGHAGLSKYGQSSPAEAIGEAFADVEVNGDAAQPLSKLIHGRLLDLYFGRA